MSQKNEFKEEVSQNNYTNIFLRNAPEPVYCYRSGLTVYEERFLDGTLVPGGWNAAGYPLNVLSNYPTNIDLNRVAEPSSFHIELDGETMDYNLQVKDFESIVKEDGCEEAILTLTSQVKSVEIKVHTLLDGTAMITRWLEVCNLSDEEVAVSRLSVFCGVLEQMKDYRAEDPDVLAEEIYQLGYFGRDGWGAEGDLGFRTLPFDKTTISGRFERMRYRHPAFFLKNKLSGLLFFGQLAWSAGYEFSFDYIAEHGEKETTLVLDMAVTGYNPLRLIAPGESFVSPKAHLGVVFGDLDDAVRETHTHLRRSVLNLPEANADACLVGSGMGPEHDMSVETTMRFADQMAAMGAEVFIIDAGWYCPPNKETEWWSRTGDWQADKERYPKGIAEVRDYIHAKGMKFGMWMEAERVGDQTECFKEHPDWFTKLPVGTTTPGFLDFTNPQAAAWAEEEIARVIQEYRLDLFRIDYNIGSAQYFYLREAQNQSAGIGKRKRTEYGTVKHYEAVYAMYQRLKRRFPDVIFENCAGGGGRTDLGMMQAFNHSWVSDQQNAPRSLYITSGMTLVLPPERVDRLVAGMGCHGHGSLELQMRNAMLGHLTLNVFSPAAASYNPRQLAFIEHSVAIYKNFIRPFLPKADMYHYNAEVAQARKEGYQALELVSQDKNKAAVTIFRLPGASTAPVKLLLRGLDLGKKYQVTMDNTGSRAIVGGWELSTHGLTTMPLCAMTSELVLIEVV